MQNPIPSKSTISQKSKAKLRLNKRQRNRRRNKQKTLFINQNKACSNAGAGVASSNRSAQQNGALLWQQAYENAVRWHGEHQNNFWRRAAENLQLENQMLRQQLILNSTNSIPSRDNLYYETSDDDNEEETKVMFVKKEEPEDEDDDIDVQYLKFLQITTKHREEMRLKRLAEAQGLADIVPQTAEK